MFEIKSFNRDYVALRKESVDRNFDAVQIVVVVVVALRKESVDRNNFCIGHGLRGGHVALRKESVDRNIIDNNLVDRHIRSLSARRAWIEMTKGAVPWESTLVALRKESVDRNLLEYCHKPFCTGRSPQGERG